MQGDQLTEPTEEAEQQHRQGQLAEISRRGAAASQEARSRQTRKPRRRASRKSRPRRSAGAVSDSFVSLYCQLSADSGRERPGVSSLSRPGEAMTGHGLEQVHDVQTVLIVIADGPLPEPPGSSPRALVSHEQDELRGEEHDHQAGRDRGVEHPVQPRPPQCAAIRPPASNKNVPKNA